MNKTIRRLTLALVAASTFQAAHADPISATFSAVVTSVLSGPSTAMGSVFHGSVNFGGEPLVDASDCSWADRCVSYLFDSVPNQFALDSGDAISVASDVSMTAEDNAINWTSDAVIDDVSFSTLLNDGTLVLLAVNGSADSLPGVTLADAKAFLSQHQTGQLFLSIPRLNLLLTAQVSDFTVSSVAVVPEPTSLALMALGLGGVALASRRRASPASAPQAVNEA